jgi:hypothetical protein
MLPLLVSRSEIMQLKSPNTKREKWGNSYWKFNESFFWKGWQSEKLKYSLLDWWEIGKKKRKSSSITFSKNLAENERKKLQTLYLLSISSSKNSCLDRIKIPFFFLFSNIIIFFLASFTLFSSTSTPSSSLSNSKYKVWKGWQSEKLKYSLLDWWEIGKKKIKSLSITFSKNLAENESKKLQTLYLE